MTQRKVSNAEGAGLPGLSMLSDLVSAYSSAWDRHVKALNEVWTDCTCPEATASDWPKAWNRLLQTWSDSAQDICNTYIVHGGVNGRGGSPFVTFVIDHSAETDAEAQTVLLPPGVDPDKIVATPLVLIEDRDSGPHVPRIAGDVIVLHKDGRLEIRISVKPVPAPPPKPTGRYLSVIYERKAGDPPFVINPSNPPPRSVIATVLVVFLDSPI